MKTLVKIHNFFVAPEVDEDGASMVEYGLLVGLIAVVVIGAVTLLGNGINDLFNAVTDALPG